MITWAEEAAREYNISRQEADEWAARSHQRAWAAITEGKFTEEIVPVPVNQPKGPPVLFSQDEHPRADSTLEVLAKLKPIIDGVCTAANSSSENDGASVTVIMSEKKMATLGIKPMGYVKAFSFAGADPRFAYKAAPAAVRSVLSKAGMTLADIDLIEIHEAFATQALANFRDLGITEKDYDRINVNGSCVSLGHPLGATGARIVTTLLHEMKRRDAKHGLVAICGGGGMGVALVVER
jgi:acetyl-CoA C-acetyltransferase